MRCGVIRVNRKLGMTTIATFLGIAGVAHAADLPVTPSSTTTSTTLPKLTGSFLDFINQDGTLTWNGITLYGTVDMGVAWQSHGTPFDGAYSNGIEDIISKNSNRARWNPAPNGLSQSNIGIKGTEPMTAGWSFIFNLQAGFDPYSLGVADSLRAMVRNDGVPLANQTSNGDSSRAGQFYNSLGYAGFSSDTFGSLTVGRQNSLLLDGIIAYDPMAASYAFSLIGYSGIGAGGGNTEDARYTTSVKYRVDYDHLSVGALYQFGGYGFGNPSTDAYQFELGGEFNQLSLDVIFSHVDNAVSLAPLTLAQELQNPGTLAATISNNTSVMLLGKYKYGPVTFFGGYEHISYAPPSDPQGAFTAVGGYEVAAVNVNNTNFDDGNKVVQIAWTGAKYAVTSKLDVSVAYYQLWQNSFGTVPCFDTSNAKCGGSENVVSAMVDWRFAKRLDAYGGLMFSQVNDGLANGFLHTTLLEPTVGVRLQF
jgi:predicted porin